MGAHYASGNAHVAETSQGGVETPEGRVLHQNMKFSRDAALSRIPAPHLLKQEQLQLAGASFRDQHFSWTPKSTPPMSSTPCQSRCPSAQFSPKHLSGRPSASDAAEVTGRTFFVLAYHVAAGRELLDAGHFSKQADFGLGAQGDKAAEGTMSRQPI